MELTPSPGASERFSEYYNENAQSIYRFCYFHIGDRAIAEEVMQDTFFRTWEYVAKGNSIEHVRAFLFKTARNLVINYYAKKRSTSLEVLQEAGFDPGEEDAELQRDVIAEHHVLEVLQKLDDEYRQVVILSFIEGLLPSEIAEAIGVTANVVSVRLHRGLKQLKSLLSVHPVHGPRA